MVYLSAFRAFTLSVAWKRLEPDAKQNGHPNNLRSVLPFINMYVVMYISDYIWC